MRERISNAPPLNCFPVLRTGRLEQYYRATEEWGDIRNWGTTERTTRYLVVLGETSAP